MRNGWEEARAALRAGFAFAQGAWREAWPALGVSAAGVAALFVAGRAALPPEAAGPLGWTGLALYALMLAPKLGALHRAAAGGGGGMSWSRAEWRLLATAVALTAFAGLLLAVEAAVLAPVLSFLRPLGQLRAPGVGPIGVGFLCAAPLLVLMLAAAADTVGRLMVTLPADAVEPNARFARGWLLTRELGAAPALVLLLTVVLPLAATALLQAALDGPGGAREPLIDAALAGAVMGGLTQFVFAPLNAGTLAHLHRRGLEAEAAAVRPAESADVPSPPAAAEPLAS